MKIPVFRVKTHELPFQVEAEHRDEISALDKDKNGVKIEKDHLLCEVSARPCCIGLQGECTIVSQVCTIVPQVCTIASQVCTIVSRVCTMAIVSQVCTIVSQVCTPCLRYVP